jgi:hypothetical protein
MYFCTVKLQHSAKLHYNMKRSPLITAMIPGLVELEARKWPNQYYCYANPLCPISPDCKTTVQLWLNNLCTCCSPKSFRYLSTRVSYLLHLFSVFVISCPPHQVSYCGLLEKNQKGAHSSNLRLSSIIWQKKKRAKCMSHIQNMVIGGDC